MNAFVLIPGFLAPRRAWPRKGCEPALAALYRRAGNRPPAVLERWLASRMVPSGTELEAMTDPCRLAVVAQAQRPGDVHRRPSATDARAAVLREARGWIGTPYHHMGRVKGAGTDCLMLLAEVYEAAGVIPHVDVPFYPPDWNLHRDAERYLEGVLAYAREAAAPGLGDVAVFKFGRCFAHGAIVTDWPLVIHAFVGVGVVTADATQGALRARPVRFFSPFDPDPPPPAGEGWAGA